MALTPEQISLMAFNDDPGDWNNLAFRDCWVDGYETGARAIEAEVRKDDEALIRQMESALSWSSPHADAAHGWKSENWARKRSEAITAARARLLDSDLSQLTERGAKAWAGVDAQALREGGACAARGAQDTRDPLTPERVKEIVRGAGYDQCGIPDTERAAFINGLRHGEREHGIRGDQHGTE